ncbi:hypothetical protein [Paenibacillus sp. J2TS4]|uniref:hypothetical protein n=1 Tax=Paenibacillus sp. J2TS4 TaxID=2807194 RepID=UPI001B06A8ED|nr:hypothetical protein [Paenibacillus sp. J2TS4]GIP35423.1 hypothetical protein J2TS4_46330 [Paenibacillus sp. J2TS4]
MARPLLFIAELLRIIVILVLGAALLWQVELALYDWVNIELVSYAWVVGLANVILIFILYRNRLQFNGWYTSARAAKLPLPVTISALALCAVLLMIPLAGAVIGLG